MTDPASPIDELLESLRVALAARQRDGLERALRVEAALGSYRRALEQQIAAEFAAEHRLRVPPAIGVSLTRAAEELHAAVTALPEVARLAAGADARESRTPDSAGPMTIKAPVSDPRGSSLTSAATAAPDLPRLRAALKEQKLVIIGALSRDKSDALPEGFAEHVEWIDTERDGVHALGNLPQRIRHGRVAGVIILDRAVKHKHSEPALAAARDAHVPTAFAGQGGRASIERALRVVEGMLAER